METKTRTASPLDRIVSLQLNDVVWLLREIRHNEFTHDYIKDEKRCETCSRIKRIRKATEANAELIRTNVSARMTGLGALRGLRK